MTNLNEQLEQVIENLMNEGTDVHQMCSALSHAIAIAGVQNGVEYDNLMIFVAQYVRDFYLRRGGNMRLVPERDSIH